MEQMGSRVTRHLTAAGHGLALAGLALYGLVLLVLALEPVIAVSGLVVEVNGHLRNGWRDNSAVVMFLILIALAPLWLLAVLSLNRMLANKVRVLCARWCDVPIALPYRSKPADQNRLRWMLTDRATWRDLLWLPVNGVAGFVLAAAPVGLLVFGLLVFNKAALDGPQRLLLSVAAAAVGVWAAPWFLQTHAQLSRYLLAPPASAELQQQVRHLTATRTETLDSGAAEIRRIERDLHDGAQARLVAMGMALDAAGQLIEDDPDRGLAEALRALALDTALRIHLTSDLDQTARPSPPIESAAYFAVNELVANVSKHAQAGQAWIDIRHNGGMLKITVTDDGQGGVDQSRGTGLTGIEHRLAAFDGVLAISSPPGGPTAVTMEIPCALS
jgi:signal transduction histidine kinase